MNLPASPPEPRTDAPARNTCPPITLMGILDDGQGSLSQAARQRLNAARLVIGASRTLDLVRPHLPENCTLRPLDGAFDQITVWLQAAWAAAHPAVVLATGDPLCYGIGKRLLDSLGPEALDILPAPSTFQLAFARLKRPWQDAALVSVHGADCGEWEPGAPHDHGLMPLLRATRTHDRIACLTAPANTPDRIARALIHAGLENGFTLSVAARLQLPDETLWCDLPLARAAEMAFPQPNVVVLERTPAPHPPELPHAAFGLPDDFYAQRHPDKGLITKLEVRAVSLARLALSPRSIVWDIGAGSGAVGIEAARLASDGHVYAIEKNPEDIANARRNARRLRLINYSLTEGRAPAGLDAWPDPDAVFIGGSGGELAQLIEQIMQRLRPGGRLVMNFVTFENLATASQTLQTLGHPMDITQLQAARSQPILGMQRLAAQNPVWIVSTGKPHPGPAENV